MLTMTRWTPWTEFAGLHRDLDTIFERMFRDTIGTSTSGTLTPPAEIRREEDAWKISLALPGVSPEHVDVQITGHTVRVSGERRQFGSAQPLLNEIGYGRFERELTIPQELDPKRVKATHRHGMLELYVPLAEGAKPYRIEVKTETDAKQLQAA